MCVIETEYLDERLGRMSIVILSLEYGGKMNRRFVLLETHIIALLYKLTFSFGWKLKIHAKQWNYA